VKGKPWSADKEQKLWELVASGADVAKIAATLGKSKDAILKKCSRLGLVVGAVKITQTAFAHNYSGYQDLQGTTS